MKSKNIFVRPINNEGGFAIIIMIVLISVMVISYSLYASNYFLLLTSEVKNAKRMINGINALQQLAQTLIEPRNLNAAGPCVLPYDQTFHELCVKDALTVKSNGICIYNPFGNLNDGIDDSDLLCLTGAPNPPTRNIIEVTTYSKPSFYKSALRSLRRFHFEVGKNVVSLTQGFSGMAMAYPETNELPALTGAPTLTKPPINKACGAGATATEECMRCRDGAGGANATRPECFTLKVCFRPDIDGDGYGDCDPAINEQWVWQMVAVISVIGP